MASKKKSTKSVVTEGKVLSTGAMITNLKGQGTIRVVIPTDVAYNVGKLTKTIKDLVGVLGCSACCSGYDIAFQTSHFVADPKTLKVRPL